MAEHLLAVLLATTSARGSALVAQWPPYATSSPRFKRAPPKSPYSSSELDNPWKASHPPYHPPADQQPSTLADDYFWESTNTSVPRDRSTSVSNRHTSSERDNAADESRDVEDPSTDEAYHQLFGYSSEFLASLLCPNQGMCHQKFELIVDEVAFIGHPVCADDDEVWRFRTEARNRHGPRGREGKAQNAPSRDDSAGQFSGWLHTFHFVFVLDLPDTSSAASGNVAKFMDVIYEQLAFPITAVLFREQVLSNFVEQECDKLLALRDNSLQNGCSFMEFSELSLLESSISLAVKAVFEAVRNGTVAYITLNDLPLELQLPPYLHRLLKSQSDFEGSDKIEPGSEDDRMARWGEDMKMGWRLPELAPWKALLLLEDDTWDPAAAMKAVPLNPDDRETAETLLKFLELASVTLSLSDMATLLDWDVETQVFPVVRWLVQHRRAKVVDLVNPGLRTVYTAPCKFDHTIAELTAEFQDAFPPEAHPELPPLPSILATISHSASLSTTNESTFYAALVKDKSAIPVWQDVVLWMLERDLLVTLHLHIRLVATVELKALASNRRKRAMKERGRAKKIDSTPKADEAAWVSMSPRTAHNFSRRMSSKDSGKSQLKEEEEESSGIDQSEMDNDDEDSIITEPGKANRKQRSWLAAMDEGKDPRIAKLFKQINQYFDGKRSDSEILYRADISKTQLRELLHHYSPHIITFLHPS
ncbi:nitrogen permease regulator of amino acid transport activity 3-domain-containing protein [Flagelloscypha sp. PMI_526]|nr:nitrogen permease regulator of amino acid transport activity 3-domain-containing protein [Flagelloscypha sp. PMI_526]